MSRASGLCSRPPSFARNSRPAKTLAAMLMAASAMRESGHLRSAGKIAASPLREPSHRSGEHASLSFLRPSRREPGWSRRFPDGRQPAVAAPTPDCCQRPGGPQVDEPRRRRRARATLIREAKQRRHPKTTTCLLTRVTLDLEQADGRRCGSSKQQWRDVTPRCCCRCRECAPLSADAHASCATAAISGARASACTHVRVLVRADAHVWRASPWLPSDADRTELPCLCRRDVMRTLGRSLRTA